MHNDEMNLAWQFVEGTNVSVFLTGKAGTGKTTFLRKLKELAPKRMVVVAPTGVAAINAQGATIHSFFQLSPGVHVPGMQEAEKTGKSRFYQMGKEKKNILRTLDLLIIDEISMVRCDLLDAIDGVLRQYKRSSLPFGGVQLLMIGDLQQLAPVATDQEWELLSPHYETPYFFSSKALKATQYVTIELKHVYRQSDEHFVNLLAKVRDGLIDQEVQSELGARYLPDFRPPQNEGWIRLTTHNYMAQRYNETQLAMLPADMQLYTASVKGNFPESMYPADMQLGLKVGAQVMFIKNDPSNEHLYYNGKIGVVVVASQHSVMVQCPGEHKVINVTQQEWNNTRYVIDEQTKEIREEVDGTFIQYPLRLAWAITVHKSQGLTFDHAVLDINDAFAHGQVYVALSRCRSMEGLVLARPLQLTSLQTDEQVDSFIHASLQAAEHTSSQLEEMRYLYFRQLLDEQFDFRQMMSEYNYLLRIVDEHLYNQQLAYLTLLKDARAKMAEKVVDVATKFQVQYMKLLTDAAGESIANYSTNDLLQQRIRAAAKYFHEQLLAVFVPVMNKGKFTIGNKQVKKQFDGAMDVLTLTYRAKMATLKTTEQEGFAVKTYLKSKAISLVEQDESKKTRRSIANSTETKKAVDAIATTAPKKEWKWYWKK